MQFIFRMGEQIASLTTASGGATEKKKAGIPLTVVRRVTNADTNLIAPAPEGPGPRTGRKNEN